MEWHHICGGLAHMVERPLSMREVRVSITRSSSCFSVSEAIFQASSYVGALAYTTPLSTARKGIVICCYQPDHHRAHASDTGPFMCTKLHKGLLGRGTVACNAIEDLQ